MGLRVCFNTDVLAIVPGCTGMASLVLAFALRWQVRLESRFG